jgi:hypothetical protein
MLMKPNIITGELSLILTFALVLGGVRPASAVLIYPSVDGTVTKDFSLGTYSTETTGPNIQAELLPSEELRGIVEFPMGSIPVGSQVSSATLSLFVSQLANATGVDGITASFQMCGYAADGTVSANDWNNDGLALQNFDLNFDSARYMTFDVTAFVQNLVSDGDSYSGFLFQGFTEYYLVGFMSMEGAGLYPAPVLDVEFTPVPEPHVMTLLLVAGSMIAFRRHWLRTHLS